MKSFSIQDLEDNIGSAIFDQALTLVENGAVKDIKQLENNLWVARAASDVEPEILLSRNKVKTYSCDCESSRKGDLCEHIAAAMILLRREKNNLSTIQKSQKTTKKKTAPKKITTANILKLASEEELKDFVRKYARSNRQFAVSLKTKFAHLFQAEDLDIKYNQVLETIIKSQVGRSSYLKTVRLRRLLKNLDELLNQAEDALAKKYYADVFALLSNFIKHVVPVIWKSNGTDLVQRLQRAFSLLNELVKKELSIELSDKMRDVLIEECPKFKYRSGETTAKFFFSLEYLCEQTNELKLLSDFIESQIVDASWGYWLSAEWQVFRYRIASKLDNEEIKNKILLAAVKDRPLFDRMIKDAEQRNDKSTLKYLIESAKENDSEFLNKMALHTEKILLSIAKEENNKKDLLRHSEKLFLDTLDMQYFELLKQNVSKKRWRTTFSKIIDKMVLKNKLWVHKEAVAALLSKEKKVAELFAYIDKIKSLVLLSKYEVVLLNWDRLKYLELFEALILNYSKHHLGSQNAKFISGKIKELSLGKEKEFARELIKKLKAEYPNRRSLVNELDLI